jgi:hypothetical protein
MKPMRHELIEGLLRARRAIGVFAAALLLAGGASAQNAQSEQSSWRIGASTGSYVPFSALIKTSDANDTRLAAGPAFALEPQYLASSNLSVFLSALLAFPTVRLGSAIRPAVLGPSDQVTLLTGTVGGVYAFGDGRIQPTVRLGGGVKFYMFDLNDADDAISPTADVGLGFRAAGLGAIEGVVEIRYLMSAFDQSKLPTRGIATQDQRQNDLLFSIGIAVRPH